MRYAFPQAHIPTKGKKFDQHGTVRNHHREICGAQRVSNRANILLGSNHVYDKLQTVHKVRYKIGKEYKFQFAKFLIDYGKTERFLCFSAVICNTKMNIHL